MAASTAFLPVTTDELQLPAIQDELINLLNELGKFHNAEKIPAGSPMTIIVSALENRLAWASENKDPSLEKIATAYKDSKLIYDTDDKEKMIAQDKFMMEMQRDLLQAASRSIFNTNEKNKAFIKFLYTKFPTLYSRTEIKLPPVVSSKEITKQLEVLHDHMEGIIKKNKNIREFGSFALFLNTVSQVSSEGIKDVRNLSSQPHEQQFAIAYFVALNAVGNEMPYFSYLHDKFFPVFKRQIQLLENQAQSASETTTPRAIRR